MPVCAGCGAASAPTRCPTCRELSVPATDSHFCSKECFTRSWDSHKLIHRR
jgi:methionyl aminopeptidase